MAVTDLKSKISLCYPPAPSQEEATHVHRQTRFLLGDGLSAHTHVSPVCSTVPRKPQGQDFSCLDQYLCMAFAQLTCRESLRDIEACLWAQRNKLYHIGIRSNIPRNTLANANKVRDWHIYADLAQSLINTAHNLYANENPGVELDQTVYALDATTIDLCLSVFPWARFENTKAAIKLHTLLDLGGNIPAFIHISDGKCSLCSRAQH